MSPQEHHVLDEFYKNAVMGADATSTILPKADHPALRQELCKQLEFYQTQKDTLRSLSERDIYKLEEDLFFVFWMEQTKKRIPENLTEHRGGFYHEKDFAQIIFEGRHRGLRTHRTDRLRRRR